MRRTLDPFRLLLVSVAGWLGQQQRDAIDYLREENQVLREQLGVKRLRLNDDQRRRLAAKAKILGRRLLREMPRSLRLRPSWLGTEDSSPRNTMAANIVALVGLEPGMS